MRYWLVTASALVISLTTGQAHAQQAASAGAAQDGLEEIVVTAQRREESLQRAGIAIAVVTGNDLIAKGVGTAADLGKAVPSLNVQAGGGANTIFFLRGVGNFTVNGYSDPAIAFNYDGVYLGRPTSTAGMFYDLERLEVLKGPQGTLYGRNATAGAINVLPARPRLGERSGFLTMSYGNFDAINAQGAVNLPMGEHGAVRVAGNVVSREGYLDDGAFDEKTQALRAQMLYELSPDLTVRVGGDYSHVGGKGAGSSYAGRIVFTPATGNVFVPSGLDPDTGLFTPAGQTYRQALFSGLAGRALTPLDGDIYQNNDFYGANAEISWKTGVGTLTVLPAWRHAKLDNKFGVPGFIGYIQEDDEQFSLEARFAGERQDIFDYILGAYYFDETVKGNYTFAQQALNAYQEFTSKTKSYALFGRLTAHLSDRLRLIGSLRYTKDDKDFEGQADVFIVRCNVTVAGRPSCPNAPLLPVTDSYTQLPASTFPTVPAGQARPIGTTGALLIHSVTSVNAPLSGERLTYRVGAEFDIAPRSLLYASFETGYRSGGFALSAGYETFEPEYIDAYTVGLKNRLFDNRLQLNVEAFLWKYRNQQVNHTGIDRAGNQGQFTENVGRSVNKGVEVEAQLLATRMTLLSANFQYLDARYKDFVYREPIGATPPLTGCAYRTSSTAGLYDIDCSGKTAYQSPKWTINLGAQQTIPLGARKIVASVDTQYKSSRVIGFQYLPSQIVGSTWTTNAQVSFGEEDDSWSLTAFVRNIENDRIPTAGQIYNAASATTNVYSPPRTYGLRGAVKF